MQDLRLIGVHEDGQHLLLADADGGRYRLTLDEALRAAARRDRPRLGQLQIEIEGGLRPRDVQALIRRGLSAEEVADRAGWTVEKVRRFEGPVLAEREHVAQVAQQCAVGSRGTRPGHPGRAGGRAAARPRRRPRRRRVGLLARRRGRLAAHPDLRRRRTAAHRDLALRAARRVGDRHRTTRPAGSARRPRPGAIPTPHRAPPSRRPRRLRHRRRRRRRARRAPARAARADRPHGRDARALAPGAAGAAGRPRRAPRATTALAPTRCPSRTSRLDPAGAPAAGRPRAQPGVGPPRGADVSDDGRRGRLARARRGASGPIAADEDPTRPAAGDRETAAGARKSARAAARRGGRTTAPSDHACDGTAAPDGRRSQRRHARASGTASAARRSPERAELGRHRPRHPAASRS